MDQILEHPNHISAARHREDRRKSFYPGVIVAFLAALVFLASIISPIVDTAKPHEVAESGGKRLLANNP